MLTHCVSIYHCSPAQTSLVPRPFPPGTTPDACAWSNFVEENFVDCPGIGTFSPLKFFRHTVLRAACARAHTACTVHLYACIDSVRAGLLLSLPTRYSIHFIYRRLIFRPPHPPCPSYGLGSVAAGCASEAVNLCNCACPLPKIVDYSYGIQQKLLEQL